MNEYLKNFWLGVSKPSQTEETVVLTVIATLIAVLVVLVVKTLGWWLVPLTVAGVVGLTYLASYGRDDIKNK